MIRMIKTSGLKVLLLGILFAIGSGSFLFPQSIDTLLFNLQENDLKEHLILNPEQIEKVQQIFTMLQSQETQDRENFRDNSLGLVGAAIRRLQMAETLLQTILSEPQKAKLSEMKEAQKNYKQYFYYKEGLSLTPEQAAKVKSYLEVAKPERQLNNIEDIENGSMAPGMTNNLPGTMVGSNMNGQRDTLQPPMPRRNDPNELIRDFEREKEKTIEKLLTPEQKKLFVQLKEYLRKELEAKLEKKQATTSSLFENN